VTDRYSFTSYITNGLVALIGWLNFEYTMMLIGTLLAIATFITNHYFKRRQDKRDHEESERRKQLHDLKIATYTAAINETQPNKIC
jgi:hypothetical protein